MADATTLPDARRGPRKLVLCFDGTGNKFHGDDSDSNILKIYRMLDRTADNQYHYYQPGIGTYVVSSSLSHTSLGSRLNSWYSKAKDSAIGSSFDQHVVGGYRFLMRFYCPGDEIYIMGFSRGAYIARFLAEMIDYVGLLSHGNEEMVSFAWKAFSQWQCRRGGGSNNDESDSELTDKQRKRREKSLEKTRKMYAFLRGFRETFSRPVSRIRFLGLFDTVNSVPRFETAWMERSKFPYTARSSARVIRHAVSIDERRAKFRQDLIYQRSGDEIKTESGNAKEKTGKEPEKYRHGSVVEKEHVNTPPDSHTGLRGHNDNPTRGRRMTLAVPEDQPARYRPRSRSTCTRTRSVSRATKASQVGDHAPAAGNGDGASISELSLRQPPAPEFDSDLEDEDEQDIDEVWFAGGHGDVGGGWETPGDGGKSASHVPLAWMVREVTRAGLKFDEDKVRAMGLCSEDGLFDGGQSGPEAGNGIGLKDRPKIDIPDIMVRSPSGAIPAAPVSPVTDFSGKSLIAERSQAEDHVPSTANHSAFHKMLHRAHTAQIHDSLAFSSGLGFMAVATWNMMEYLPFRRMDLKGDNSWRPIRWPLPGGEVRDIPNGARVHGSVIRRLRTDEKYRPGNLIIGGGGRGVRIAPEKYGIGEWDCVGEYGDPVGEVWTRRPTSDTDTKT